MKVRDWPRHWCPYLVFLPEAIAIPIKKAVTRQRYGLSKDQSIF